MSALEACKLFVGASFYLRWDPGESTAPLIPVYIHRVDIGADRSPRNLVVFVTRETPSPNGDNVRCLSIIQKDAESIPSMCYNPSGDAVIWSLPPANALACPEKHGTTVQPFSTSACKRSANATSSTSFNRPLRAISSHIFNELEKFPAVPQKEIHTHSTCIRRDIRDKTSCTLWEWEELVRFVKTEIRLCVRHEPEYELRDVPRYDIQEMTMNFRTIRDLLSLFKHLTSDTLRQFIMKEKKNRKRRRVLDSECDDVSGVNLVRLLGDFVSDQRIISENVPVAFTVGSVYQHCLNMDEHFKYPVLYRECAKWNDLERMYEFPLQLQWMAPGSLHNIQQTTKDVVLCQEKPLRRGRRRVSESFLGLKWIRSIDQSMRTTSFHSIDASDIQGTLHFCIPAIIFVGGLLVPDIKRLLETTPRVFDLR